MKTKTKRLTLKDLNASLRSLGDEMYRNEEAQSDRAAEMRGNHVKLLREVEKWKRDLLGDVKNEKWFNEQRNEAEIEIKNKLTNHILENRRLKNLFYYGSLLIVLLLIITNLI